MAYAERVREKDQEVPLNLQTIGKLRKKVHSLEVELVKARKESTLLEALSQIGEANVPATSLMTFLSFIFQARSEIEDQCLAYLKDLFDSAQYRLIEAYETRIGTINQMNCALI